MGFMCNAHIMGRVEERHVSVNVVLLLIDC